MKIIKIIILISTALMLMIILYILYDSHWSSNAQKGKNNILNSRKIKFQTSQENVLSIMGKPDTIIEGHFYYNTNNDSYTHIEFSFDSLGKVKTIYSPDN